MLLNLLTLVVLAAPFGQSPVIASGPLDFRCDNMEIHSKPNRSTCVGNVIVQRGELLVCCDRFEGEADEKWGWQRFVCYDKVRAKRGDELMWAKRAEFVLSNGNLYLFGQPLVKRGMSVILGDKVVIDTQKDHAQVENPRARLYAADSKKGMTLKVQKTQPGAKLPAICPLPPRPKIED
ncbi:hypothetical protein KAI87_01460 [Myxococcota bacterium]|nr:hypothetical protein [Myxococcota bacterium]